MSEAVRDFLFFGMAVSILGYLLGLFLKKKLKLAIFNPLLISIASVMIVLRLLDISYESYHASAKYLSYLLTPATVCLAVPLYQQLHLLKRHAGAISLGILSGVLTSLGSVYLLSLLFQLDHQQYATLLPKSITTAIGMGISEEAGGIVTITVAVIIVTGIWGNMIAEAVCKLCGITDPIAKGLAIGSSSHAIGTVKAMEMGEIEGAMSSLAIAVAGLCTVVLAPLFTGLI